MGVMKGEGGVDRTPGPLEHRSRGSGGDHGGAAGQQDYPAKERIMQRTMLKSELLLLGKEQTLHSEHKERTSGSPECQGVGRGALSPDRPSRLTTFY